MAQVPVYNTPQVEPQNTPQQSITVQTDANKFGGAIGKGESSIGAGLNDVATESNKILQMQQTVKASEALNSSLNYYQDRSQQFYQLRGEQVTPEAVAQYRQDMQEHFKDTASGLSRFAQMHYMEWSARYLNNYQEGAVRYADQQQRVGLTNEGEKTIDIAIRNAGMGANDPSGKPLGEARLLMEKGIEQVSQAKGMAPFERDELQAQAGKKFDAEIIKKQMQNPALSQDLKERLSDPDWRKLHFPYTDDSDAAVYISRINAEQSKDIAKQGYAGLSAVSNARGIRNNNPGNLVESGIRWQGLTGKDDSGKATFDTPEAGLRALSIDLHNQGALHDKYTVEDIIGRYAPPDSNNTAAYSKFVSNYMGVSAKEKLDLNDPNTLTKLTSAIVTYENGGNPYKPDMIRNAALVAAAHIPHMQGQLEMAEGNPAAQMEIASNASITTTRQADDAAIAALPDGPNKINASMAIEAKWEVLDPIHGDPAGYVQSKAPELHNQLVAGITKDPAQLPSAMDKIDNMYDSLGVPVSERRYLPNADVEKFVDSALTVSPHQTLETMQQLEQNTGIYWPKVHADIAPYMPTWWQAAASTSDMSARAQMARAAEGFTTEETAKGRRSNEEILKMLPQGKESLKEINKELAGNQTMTTLVATMLGNNRTNSEAGSYNAFAARLAVQKMAEEGKDPKDAVESAVNDIVGTNFKFLSTGDKVLIPASRFDIVKSNASYALDKSSPDQFAVPPNSSSSWLWYYGMKYQGSWAMASDGQGMVRRDAANKPVMMRDGSPMEIRFSAGDNKRAAMMKVQSEETAKILNDYADQQHKEPAPQQAVDYGEAGVE